MQKKFYYLNTFLSILILSVCGSQTDGKDLFLAESIDFTTAYQEIELSQGTSGSLANYISTSDSKSTEVYLTAKSGESTTTWITVDGKNLNGTGFTSGAEFTFEIDAVNLSPGVYNTTVTATSEGYTSGVLEIELIVSVGNGNTLPQLKFNFQDINTIPPTGWIKETGSPYGPKTSPDFSYGWKKLSDREPVDLTANGRNRSTPDDVLKATLMHLQGNHIANFSGSDIEGIWEIEAPDGNYEVSVTAGDPSEINSIHQLNVEGFGIINNFTPSSATKFHSATRVISISDGFLTLDAVGGTNTKVNSLELKPYTGNRPYIITLDIEDGATNVNVNTSIATSAINSNDGIKNTTLTSENVRLIENGTGALVPASINGSAAGDVIVLSPQVSLKPDTKYRYEVNEGVTDESGLALIPYGVTFTTGSGDQGGLSENIKFHQVPLENTTDKHTTITIGPDNNLYGITYEGLIKKYTILDNGTLSDPEIISSLQSNEGNTPRLAIGLTFDPSSTAENLIAWVTHSSFAFDKAPEWDGKLSKLTGANLETVQDVLVNLPRSYKDHLTNSIAFGPDGALYFNQGSSSAMGRRDKTWGDRDEALLSAAVLRVDLNKLNGVTLPLDVKTADGGGSYNPYDQEAPLTLYATGVRNAYDLVWHSNGQLYVPTNGSAAGGNTPASVPGTLRPDGETYNGPEVQALEKVNISMKDYLFRVEQGGYYGHPNPIRGEYVMNGGNPTSNFDVAEVNTYPVGTLPDENYRGFAYDFQENKSPNGVIEYSSNTFDGALKGKILVVRYSKNDDILVLQPDNTDFNIKQATNGSSITGFSIFNDPLDLCEDKRNGNIYVSEYGGDGRIILLKPVEGGGTLVDVEEQIFSGVKNTTSSPKSITFTNSGSGSIVIDDIQLQGADATAFEITNLPTLPKSISAQESLTLNIVFKPNEKVGSLEAQLVISTDDIITPQVISGLYGLSTNGLEGSNEPPFYNIVKTLGYKVDVGGTTLVLSTEPDFIGEEVFAENFIKAGNGKIEIIPVARYSPLEPLPFGYYTHKNNEVNLMEIGILSDDSPQHQTLFPELQSGETTFDPGSTSFGLYTSSTNGTHITYSQRGLNPGNGPENSIKHLVRVYPLKDREGNPVLNSYLVGFEEASNGDYQDYVFVIKNVKPAPAKAPTLNQIHNPSAIDMDAGEQTIELSGITAGAGEVQSIQVSAISGNTDLIPNPIVEYTSPNTTGILKFTTVTGASGIAEISVTVKDNGPGDDPNLNTLTRSFTVYVNGANNKAPSIDPISDQEAIEEDAPAQVVELKGITSGTIDYPTITITASSDNPDVIQDPVISYTSPNATGTLTYTPVPDAFGDAMITVVVKNNGPNTNGDINSYERSFFVSVLPVNDAPSISTLENQETGEGESIGPLAFQVDDIDNNIDDLKITVGSSDESIVKSTGISVAGSGKSRTLSISPLPLQKGIVMITIKVSDGEHDAETTFRLNVGEVTNADENELKTSFSFYPNPTSSEIEVLMENEDLGTVEVRIVDLLGKVHKSQLFRKEERLVKYRMNLENLSSGTYIIQVVHNGTFRSKRLIMN